jgi:methylmalonyl-CoA mutase cobalamin-binding subunit
VTPPERSYEIHEVARLTGLSSARLRAWERRYEVVGPRRLPNGYRAYTADQVALLRTYARLTQSGERIGHLAGRPRDAVLVQAEEQERQTSAFDRGSGPLAVAARLPGERHEWGFLCALTKAQDEGWRVHYLGPHLPPGEVVEVAWTLRPEVVALSASAPATVSANLAALEALPGKLPPGVAVVIGGGGIEPYATTLVRFGYGLGLDAFPRPEPAQHRGARE